MRPALRRQGWEERLEAAISGAGKEGFQLGRFDCFLFAARCVLASTGVDIATDYRMAYNSKETALALIRKEGGFAEGVGKLLASVGIHPCDPNRAQRGDILLLPGTDEWPGTLAVCLGATCAAPGPNGLRFTKTLQASHAWHVEQAPLCRN